MGNEKLLLGRFKFEIDEVVYGGQLMNPFEGYTFGCQVGKILAGAIPSIGGKGGDDSSSLSMVCEAVGSLGAEVLSNMVLQLLKKSGIQARNKRDSELFLIDGEHAFNKWFSERRQDVFPFGVQLIVEHATPFLPKDMQGSIKGALSTIGF